MLISTIERIHLKSTSSQMTNIQLFRIAATTVRKN